MESVGILLMTFLITTVQTSNTNTTCLTPQNDHGRALEDMKLQFSNLQTKIELLEGIVKTLKDDVKRRDPLIGFLVRYHGSYITVGNQGQTVPYNQVIWNLGDGFKPSLHVFSAPKPGLYAFNVNLLSGNAHGCFYLVKNGDYITHGWSPRSHATATSNVALPLKAGDIVSVKACRLSTLDDDTANFFSGYLIHEEKA